MSVSPCDRVGAVTSCLSRRAMSRSISAGATVSGSKRELRAMMQRKLGTHCREGNQSRPTFSVPGGVQRVPDVTCTCVLHQLFGQLTRTGELSFLGGGTEVRG